MKRFSLQLATFTAFCLGLIWFAGEGEALQSSHAGEVVSGDIYATETLHINLDEMRGKKREKGTPRLSDGVYRHTRKLSEAILDIRNRYMDEIDMKELVDAGIRGMLQNLDRYSVLMERETYDNLMEHTAGRYQGLGMQIDSRNDRIVIISPLEGGPAEKLGLRAGDVIVDIEGTSTLNMKTSEASKLMRGEAGTSVTIKIDRERMPDLLEFTVTRAFITLHSVNYAGRIPGTDIGYIRLSSFSSNSRKELRKAVREMEKEDLKGLVFDLRSNGGGLLDQAVATAELFVPNNSMIVYTQGQEEISRKTFYSKRDPLYPSKPLIVLVDEGTASASEIVAGALQDLDRAVVLGQPTFGKGLVQQVFAFDDDPTQHLKLTTARYYVPSGRCIQREDRQEKFDPRGHLSADDETTDSMKVEDREVFHTQNGRDVFGGGGIVPDVTSEHDYWEPIAINMRRQSLFFDFASKYVADHPDLTVDFQLSDAIVEEYRKFVQEHDFDYKTSLQVALEDFQKSVESEERLDLFSEEITDLEEIIAKDKADDFDEANEDIRLAILREMVSHLGGEKARYEHYILKTDKTIAQAVTLLQDMNEYNRLLTEGSQRAALEDANKSESD